MAGTQKKIRKSSLFEPSGHGDLYALDNLYLSPLRENEVWNFSKVAEFSPFNLGFLSMRSILAYKTSPEPIVAGGFTPGFVKGLSKVGNWERLDRLKIEGFIPRVLGSEFPLRVDSGIHPLLESVLASYERELFEEWNPPSVTIEGIWDKKNLLIAGVALPENEKHTPSLLKELIRSLSGVSGKFYLRTEKHSYLCLKKDPDLIGPVFFQEKETIWDPFVFLILEKDFEPT
ncbi:hypothetical protein EHQ12_04475 [Leptospira gomenensis]|uniref:Uncharacterized protein n=1 Tax=Leptospira gomenensis TaxID=2484974 RepID=A0A5F1YFK6_9LEPT|nr:hypothetical protein [Leptospira gomenensis]TGK38631.1 hypothetical protein EHQ17_00905 [Leptospira gomenensis]TGK42868.1 hypothetical protein EHQ12_04475 [Leptospira gomenensis]TGK49587.1 hypothetical protein EHQ07_04700 [Leptospira gomenensis]TGK60743.1 hypothetical protein EHQ13_10370 [Leptospira gomenensis]